MLRNFRSLLATLSIFLLSACASATLPDQKRDLQSFIPAPQEEVARDPDSFDFISQNFPKECEWIPFVRVVDGDTIIVAPDVSVRLIGIDTPETKHPSRPVEPFGIEASEKLSSLLSDSKKVCLVADPLGDEIDTYGRRLAYVFAEDGTDVEIALLQSGLAKGYFSFPFSREEEFRFYHQQAKEARLGLWK